MYRHTANPSVMQLEGLQFQTYAMKKKSKNLSNSTLNVANFGKERALRYRWRKNTVGRLQRRRKNGRTAAD